MRVLIYRPIARARNALKWMSNDQDGARRQVSFFVTGEETDFLLFSSGSKNISLTEKREEI